MMRFFAILSCLVLFSCNKYVTRTIYENPGQGYYGTKKVLVIGISAFGNTTVEREIEESMICLLSKSGFDALSYVDASAMYSMAMISQDAVAFILKENNIDYVLTVANVNESLGIPLRQPGGVVSLSYYRHVLAYQSGQASPAPRQSCARIWESILFDVHSSDACLITQTRCLSLKDKNKEINAVTNQVANQTIRVIQPGQLSPKGF